MSKVPEYSRAASAVSILVLKEAAMAQIAPKREISPDLPFSDTVP